MAPEQTRGIVTTLTDIYALGVLLYQMLTGELPYNDPDDVRVIQMHLQAPIPSPCDHDTSVPAELADVVRTAMAKRSEARYQNVAELRAAFLAAIKEPVVPIQEEDASIEEPLLPRPRRLLSASMAQEDAPLPIVMPQRIRNETSIEVREKQRITEDIKNKPRTIRITEEPIKYRRKHLTGPMVISILVPLTLLTLLLVPRLLGVSFFPPGFPVLGTPPVATIFVTAQSKLLQNSYVLTSMPQVNTPDLTTHTIPNRALQASAADSKTVQTTGSRTIPGVPSLGTVVFTNTGDAAMTVQPMVLSTPAGVQVRVKQMVQVPAHQGGQDGTATASATAVQVGVTGNIAAHALDGPCCNGLTVKNLEAFSGGVDPRMVHIISQADLDSVQNALAPKIQQQVTQQLQKQMLPDEVMVGQPAYQITATPNNPVGTQVDQVQVLVRVSGSVTVYNRNIANHTAAQLLSKEAVQTLGNNYQLQGTPAILASPQTQQGQNGVVYLSVSVRGLWIYALSTQQVSKWRQSIKGATSAAALAYLNEQPGVATVEIHLPFGADHLPSSIDDIRIIQIGDGTS